MDIEGLYKPTFLSWRKRGETTRNYCSTKQTTKITNMPNSTHYYDQRDYRLECSKNYEKHTFLQPKRTPVWNTPRNKLSDLLNYGWIEVNQYRSSMEIPPVKQQMNKRGRRREGW